MTRQGTHQEPGRTSKMTAKRLNDFFVDQAKGLTIELVQAYTDTNPTAKILQAEIKGIQHDGRAWVKRIKAGELLRVLQFVGAYDGKEIHLELLTTALRTMLFVFKFCDELNGEFMPFGHYKMEISGKLVSKVLRFIQEQERGQAQ